MLHHAREVTGDVLVRPFLRSPRVVVAVDEIADHRRLGLAPVVGDETLFVRGDRGRLVVPRALAERHHARAEVGRREDGVGRHGDAVRAPFERPRRRGSQRCARLGEERTVALDVAGFKGIEDHRCRLVETITRLVHGDAEPCVFSTGEAASHSEQHSAVGEVIEQCDLLGDAQGIVPREDHGSGAEFDLLRERRHVGEEPVLSGQNE